MLDYDVIVIGSGFGGAITACRLAEANYKVLILERGRQWSHEEQNKNFYPRSLDDPERWIWSESEPERFKATDLVSPNTGRLIAALPRPLLAAFIPLVPTYIWIGTLAPTTPAGPPLRVPPRPLASRASHEPRSSG